MRIRSGQFVVLAIIALVISNTFGDVASAMSRTGVAKVSFSATGPAGLKIIGTTAELAVSEAAGNVSIRVPLAGIDTGIGLRNKHMREKYLQVDRFPNAELVVPRASLTLPASDVTTSGNAKGTMMIHGKSKPVSFHYGVVRHANHYQVTGNVHVNMNDYGIDTPGYFGVTVKPDIDVVVAFEVVE